VTLAPKKWVIEKKKWILEKLGCSIRRQAVSCLERIEDAIRSSGTRLHDAMAPIRNSSSKGLLANPNREPTNG
jgi:hypothetical protein